jgi:adenylosuccinate synthase
MRMNTQFSENNKVVTVLGCQWGDEGKGKLVDILAEKYDIIARATGGANAGHTIYVGDKKVVFHLIPSGVLHEGKVAVIGNGCVVHIPTLFEEIETLKKEGITIDGRLWISDRTHIVCDFHRILDGLQEEQKGGKKIGTTKRGIGPAYTDKMMRMGIRVGELLDFATFEEHYRSNLAFHQKAFGPFDHDSEKELSELRELSKKIQPFVIDTAQYLDEQRKAGKTILLEGANGAMLDIDHGTYPFVTSSNASLGGIVTGTGVAARHIQANIGIVKAYTTRVGSGPFPTELLDATGDAIREKGGEYGATTGRPRRCGWFDAVVVKYACMINGITDINLTKLDILSGLPVLKIATGYKNKGATINGFPADLKTLETMEIVYEELPGWNEPLDHCTSFDQLPENAKKYIERIEQLVEAKITFIGVGRDRKQMIVR